MRLRCWQGLHSVCCQNTTYPGHRSSAWWPSISMSKIAMQENNNRRQGIFLRPSSNLRPERFNFVYQLPKKGNSSPPGCKPTNTRSTNARYYETNSQTQAYCINGRQPDPMQHADNVCHHGYPSRKSGAFQLLWQIGWPEHHSSQHPSPGHKLVSHSPLHLPRHLSLHLPLHFHLDFDE